MIYGIHGFGGPIDLGHELGDGLDAEIDPLAEVRIREVADFDISLGIETGLPPERRDGVVVEARPRVFPAIEVGHPVRDVHVDAIDACRRNLADALHVLLAPRRGVREIQTSSSPFRIQNAAPPVKMAGSPVILRCSQSG